jgi:NAD(P)-dependent dehydrogenase (short-subunit alcohol dehydrogenase family)
MDRSINSFSRQSVLITGCSSGIGRTTALHLARNGFTVFATVRKESDVEMLRAFQEPDLIPVYPLDLTRTGDILPILKTIKTELDRRKLPGLFALINNAGGGGVAPLELMDLAMFQRELQTRLVGSMALIQAFLPLLRQGGGRIIWIMTPAIIPTPYVGSIHACDFAANCLARTLDIELKPWRIPNIQVRCGGINTTKGLETTAQSGAILQHPRAELYRSVLNRWSQEMVVFDQKRTPTEAVAQVVETALRARHPRQRYAVGHMSGLAAVLEALPQGLADLILKMRY